MKRLLPFLVFAIVLGAARILGSHTPETLGNLQPLGALFFCGMALFGLRGIILPTLVWLITYPLTNLHQGYGWSAQMIIPLLGFLAMILLARSFQKASPGKVFLGSLASALVFYLVTNTLSWAIDPLYPKSFAGLAQALTVGLPQFATPTWMFFRNSLISQSVFSALFIIATQTMTARVSSKEKLAPQSI